jgi:hypothetical protein
LAAGYLYRMSSPQLFIRICRWSGDRSGASFR